MDFASLFNQIGAMFQSDAAMFTIGGITITEKAAVVIGAVATVLTIISLLQLVLHLITWITKPKVVQVIGDSSAVIEPNVAPRKEVLEKTEPPEVQVGVKKTTEPTQETDSLVDTSDKKRSLYDYVTPDSIHAEVLKQTINNDYPYQTLKPNEQKLVNSQPKAPLEPELPLSAVEFQKMPKLGASAFMENPLPNTTSPQEQTPTTQVIPTSTGSAPETTNVLQAAPQPAPPVSQPTAPTLPPIISKTETPVATPTITQSPVASTDALPATTTPPAVTPITPAQVPETIDVVPPTGTSPTTATPQPPITPAPQPVTPTTPSTPPPVASTNEPITIPTSPLATQPIQPAVTLGNTEVVKVTEQVTTTPISLASAQIPQPVSDIPKTTKIPETVAPSITIPTGDLVAELTAMPPIPTTDVKIQTPLPVQTQSEPVSTPQNPTKLPPLPSTLTPQNTATTPLIVEKPKFSPTDPILP